jgi:hypothetical protein
MIVNRKKLNLLWLLCFTSGSLLLCGCVAQISGTKQLPDGTLINYTVKRGGVDPVENDWAKMIAAATTIKTEKGGPVFIWQFGMIFKVSDIQSVTVIDVTSATPETLVEQSGITINPKGNYFYSHEIPYKSPELSWLFDSKGEAKFFKIVLKNSSGEEKTFYQAAVYPAAGNNYMVNKVEEVQRQEDQSGYWDKQNNSQ